MFPPDSRIARASSLLVNFSGGKDSLAMLLEALDTVDRDRILVHHQDLGEADWPETRPYVESVCKRLSVRLVVEQSPRGGLLEMLKQAVVNRREDLPGPKGWPDARRRWCTSYLKRDVANHYIRTHRAELGSTTISLTGERREESSRRASREAWQIHSTSTKKQDVWWYRPMLDWTESRIWDRIRRSGLDPHPCYGYGVSRASCFMCIFARKQELAIAIGRHPERFRAFVDVERELGHRFRMNLSLEDLWNEVRPGNPSGAAGSHAITQRTEGDLPLSA